MQEAYRPQRNKYSTCCPILRGGTYLGWGGTYLGIPLAEGYLPWLGGTYLGRGVPTLAGGTYLGVPPVLTWPEGTYLGWVVPTLAGGRGTYLGWGYLPWGTPCPDLAGVPTLEYSHLDLARGTYVGVTPIWTWLGYLPPSVNRLKTLPSPSFRCSR